ncbi:MAG: hypothetical protein Q4F83_03700 [Eubacteriales bacterium]|nr:hypothetical protein [Eubacteriales bacterium]
MRSFKKILFRAVALVLFTVLLEWGIRFCYQEWKAFTVVSRQEREELQGTLDTLYCGNSLTYRGFCPALLDEKLGTNSFNLGTSQQTLSGVYYLLRETAEQNPIKKVYLGLSISMLKEEMPDEAYVSAAENFCSPVWKMRYLMAVGREPVFVSSLLFSTRVETYMAFSKVKTNIRSKLSGRKSSSRYGKRGWRTSSKKYAGKGQERNADGKYWDKELGISQLQQESLTYLKKITEFCNENEIQLTWVFMPLSQPFVDGAGDMDDLNETLGGLAEEFGAEYYNFILYKERKTVFTNDKFKDSTHLNTEGSKVFSTLLSEIVSSKNPGDYFYGSMEEYKEEQI